VAAFGVLSTLALGWSWWKRRRMDPWARQMMQLRDALSRTGLACAAHEAPRSLARRVRAAFGAAGEPLAGLLESLDAQRYGRIAAARPDRRLTREFIARAEQLKRSSA
jgi:hypothetical protein